MGCWLILQFTMWALLPAYQQPDEDILAKVAFEKYTRYNDRCGRFATRKGALQHHTFLRDQEETRWEDAVRILWPPVFGILLADEASIKLTRVDQRCEDFWAQNFSLTKSAACREPARDIARTTYFLSTRIGTVASTHRLATCNCTGFWTVHSLPELVGLYPVCDGSGGPVMADLLQSLQGMSWGTSKVHFHAMLPCVNPMPLYPQEHNFITSSEAFELLSDNIRSPSKDSG